ncbi:MAG: tetratricopeptide (TPR) repeat protein/SAM-dependent methyltransferase [Gammaproteobacteria bacterium]|jgi:tetratricopeptide (TPR) repeat protein/SAM-dependent methyltransferase
MVDDEPKPGGPPADDASGPRTAEVNAWLRTAVDRHQAGEFAQAQDLYEQILAQEPAHADALQYFGILCQQTGDSGQAEHLIRQAIAVRPDVAPYHDNLGTVLEQAGQFDAALSAYREAERLEPGIVERACNVGLVLERLGRHKQAERHYRVSIECHAHDMDSRLALANLLSKGDDLRAAIQAYREILDINENHASARIGLGNVLQDDGQLDTALDEYRRVIARYPENAEAWHNQGRALVNVARFGEAHRSFERALRFDPELAEAKLGLARMLERLGLFERAYSAFRVLCMTDTAADEDIVLRARAGLLRVVRVLPLSEHDALLVGVMLSAIESGNTVASHCMHALGSQLAAKAGLTQGDCVDDADALRRAVALQSDPLFVVALEQCANVVPAVERWLCAVRRALLHANAGELVGREPLLRALAMQGSANEYVFAVSDDEVGVIDAVLAQLEPQTASGLLASDDNVRDLLLCACYGPLSELWSAETLAEFDCGTLGPWLAPIVQHTVVEPYREREMAAAIEELAPIANASSQLVRTQYEEHPYPRWRELPPVLPLAADSFSINCVADAVAAEPQAPFLVAGCGTGFEPLLLAAQFPERPIVALDLSRASLGYASRMAAQLGIGHVRFVHGDLFDVDHLDCEFAMIAASGVLHHLADPLAGWRALTEHLRANGVMKVALYSRRARAAINVARERVGALGLSADTQGVRALRARVLAGMEPALSSLLDSEDFYTTSMCRDLIFHPLEHQFDLQEIATMLDTLGLQFEGFELPHPLLKQQFLAAQLGSETDLEAWAKFEERNPRTFDGMYVMWCRKN